MKCDEEPGGLPRAADLRGTAHGRAPQRTGKAERARRYARIAEMLGCAVPSGAIVTRVAGEFAISLRQARSDLARVRDRWAVEIAKEEPHRRTRLLATLDHVISEGIVDRCWGPVVAACRELAKIYGPAMTKVEVSTNGVSADAVALLGALKLTNAQRMAEIDKLEEELGVLPVLPVEKEPRIAGTRNAGDDDDDQDHDDQDHDDQDHDDQDDP